MTKYFWVGTKNLGVRGGKRFRGPGNKVLGGGSVAKFFGGVKVAKILGWGGKRHEMMIHQSKILHSLIFHFLLSKCCPN